MIRDAAAGRMPAYVDTGLNIVHVDDVAEGHVLALERGRIGERYILGGEDFSLARDARHGGGGRRRAGRRGMRCSHDGCCVPVALACEGAGAACGIEPVVTRETLAMARKKMFFSSAKARAELGYAPRPAREAIADAVAWFRRTAQGRCMPGACTGMTWLAALALLVWLYLLLGHGRFWQAGPMLRPPCPPRGTRGRGLVVVRRATRRRPIEPASRSLLAQDYPGAFAHHPGR